MNTFTTRITRAAAVAAATVCLSAPITLAGSASASPDASTTPPVSVSSTPAQGAAVDFVDSHMGDTAYDGLCQRLVREAFASGGEDITAFASDNSSAVSYWNTTSLPKNGPSTDIPAGSLIFWGATPSNPDGHVALALGGDSAASSEERDNTGVHVFSISARNAAGYEELGYVTP